MSLHVKNHVFDVADPRHVGRIVCLSISEQTASVRWLESGQLSVRVPLANLELATAEMMKPAVPPAIARLKGDCQEQLRARLRGPVADVVPLRPAGG